MRENKSHVPDSRQRCIKSNCGRLNRFSFSCSDIDFWADVSVSSLNDWTPQWAGTNSVWKWQCALRVKMTKQEQKKERHWRLIMCRLVRLKKKSNRRCDWIKTLFVDFSFLPALFISCSPAPACFIEAGRKFGFIAEGCVCYIKNNLKPWQVCCLTCLSMSKGSEPLHLVLISLWYL